MANTILIASVEQIKSQIFFMRGEKIILSETTHLVSPEKSSGMRNSSASSPGDVE
jgi:hypothetical protein